MPALNWTIFEQLPGSADYNFEMLCRAIIRRLYGRFGSFYALSNQPGVEFHLKLEQDCALGESGRWFGWQCRWYGIPSGTALGTTRKNKIVEAIRKTEQVLPNLTNWVLWTRHTLTARDQEWFYAISTKMKLELRTSIDIEDLLTGEAEILRRSYFGDLVLTSNLLEESHHRSVARIKQRWIPEVHQEVEAERQIREMLAETDSWTVLTKTSNLIKSAINNIRDEITSVPDQLSSTTDEFIILAQEYADLLKDIYSLISEGDFELFNQRLESRPPVPTKTIVELPRKLRAVRLRSGLFATNILADIYRANTIINKVKTFNESRIVSILSGAGGGKTQLAAQLTSPSLYRPAGILLYGQDLGVRQSIDSLAQRISIQGIPVPSMDALLSAVDAAGQRSRKRIPIVIDGLNEAEDPREWKRHLASLQVMLQQYPYVLIICTLRPDFANEALPDGIKRLEIPNFGKDIKEAIRKYFSYYRINASGVDLPIELLNHPLTLRIFCEVTNPSREREVGIELMPRSLAALFDKYIQQVIERIVELAPTSRRFLQQDIRSALDQFGWYLWETCNRSVDFNVFRNLINDDRSLWNDSMVNALEQNGIFIREAGTPSTGNRLKGVYDALSGYLIASSILSHYGQTELSKWLKNKTDIKAFTGDINERHPLWSDILRALVSLLPRKHNRQQLWQLVNEPLRHFALLGTIELESTYLDMSTVNELEKILLKRNSDSIHLLNQLAQTRNSLEHPLNANFLDSVLRNMKMSERDIFWTEWVRKNQINILNNLRVVEKFWKDEERKPFNSDRLRALWVMWTLTSTIRNLRDQATRTLYWYGRKNPKELFNQTIESLSINDPYVCERMLAAAYGVSMALSSIPSNEEFLSTILPQFASDLYNKIFDIDAPFSTTHALIRDYASHIIKLSSKYNRNLLEKGKLNRVSPPYKDGGIRNWERSKGSGFRISFDFGGPLHTDFANYSLGRLVPDRRNYDFDNPEYQMVLENILWRIEQLGYSYKNFEEIDKKIASEGWSYRLEGNEGRIDRYGKKYSWIAYFELFGFRSDNQLLEEDNSDIFERPSDVDIDPSFPDEPNDMPIVKIDWIGNRKKKLSTWIKQSNIPDINPFLIVKEIRGIPGPWILLDGYIAQVEKQFNRGVHSFIHGMLSTQNSTQLLQDLLINSNLSITRFPQAPDDYYTFAGEIPWSDTFPLNIKSNLECKVGERTKTEIQEKIKFYKKGQELDKATKIKFLIKNSKDLKEKSKQELEELLEKEGVTLHKVREKSTVKEGIYKSIPILHPIRKNNWESYHSSINPRRNAIVPAKNIAELFELSIHLPSWDMYDKKGKVASMWVKWERNQWDTEANICYLRKDILDKYLKKKHMEFFWSLWGSNEADMHYEQFRKQQLKFTRMVFNRLFYYSQNRIKKGKGSQHLQ